MFSSAGRSKSRLEKHMRAVLNQYGQSADRYYAMQQLLELETVPAIVGVMRRFTMNASKSIEDEEEKNWLSKRLLGLDKALLLPAAMEFCVNNDNIAWVLRIVEDRANEREEWELFDALVAKHPPGYERDPAKKLQLLTHMAELDNPRVLDIFIPYLDDPDEGIRFHVVEALVDICEPDTPNPAVLAALVRRLANPEEDSLRVKTRILTGIARLGWDVSAHQAEVAANIGSEHKFDGAHIKEL